MEGQIWPPNSWEKKKQRTPRLSSEELSAKLNTSTVSDDQDEDIQADQTGAKRNNATSRSSPKKVASVVAKFCGLKRKLVQSIGFDGILELPQINKVDRQFTLLLLSRIDCNKRTLNINPSCSIQLRDTDVHRVLGIPCGKLPVCGLGNDDPEEKIDFIRLCIGTGGVEQYDSLAAAEINVQQQYLDGMSDCQAECFKISFVVFLICRFLVPISHSNAGSKTFWGALFKGANISSYNWSAYVLDALIDAARKAQYDMAMKKAVSNVSGCPLFLQVLFLDHIRFGVITNQIYRLPRVADYGCEIMSKLIQAHRNKQTTIVKQDKAQNSAKDKGKDVLDGVGGHSLFQQVCDTTRSDMNENIHQEQQESPFAAMEHNTTSLASFYQAVSTAKLPMRQKVVLKWHMAQMLKHINAHKNAILRDGIKLVQKLSAQEDTDDEASLGTAAEGTLGRKRALDGYLSGCESGSEGTSDAQNVSKKMRMQGALPYVTGPPKAIHPHGNQLGNQQERVAMIDCPSFELGIEGPRNAEPGGSHSTPSTQPDRRVHQHPAEIRSPIHSASTMFNTPKQSQKITPAIPQDEAAHDDEFLTPLQRYPNFKPLSPNTALSLTPPPLQLDDASAETMQHSSTDLVCVTPAQVTKSGSTNSPGTLNSLYSETAVFFRMVSSDTDLNLNGKSLAYDFTDSPVSKRKCSGGRLAKSPWSQQISHPKRDHILTTTFFEWLASTTSPDLHRVWIMHNMPRHVEVSGDDLKNMICRKQPFSYDLFDVAIRRLIQLDNNMYAKDHLRRWRHMLESDFAMLVLAGEQATNNVSIRHQFVGSLVTHGIELCRMIIVPALVRQTWCCYFWDMKLKCVHVFDPLFNKDDASTYEEIHNPNVKKLQAGLDCCVEEFFEGWCPGWNAWNTNYVKPVTPNASISDSGIIAVMAVRDFNGTDFADIQTEQGGVTNSKHLILHEVLSITNNDAKPPGKFVQFIDD